MPALALAGCGDEPVTPFDEVMWSDVASRVCELMAAGRADELAPFFAALEEAETAPLSLDEYNDLNVGLIEDLIHGLDSYHLPTGSIYRLLLPESRLVWEQLWAYLRGAPWSDAIRDLSAPGA